MRNRKAVLVGAFLAGAVLATAGLAGAGRSLVASLGSVSAGDPAAGRRVFASAGCGGCHTLAAAGARGTVGPSLDRAKPTFDRVVARVTSGSGVMPPFRARLTAQQIEDVAAFVVQATGGAAAPARPSAAAGSASRAEVGVALIRVTVQPSALLVQGPQLVGGRATLLVRNATSAWRFVSLLRLARSRSERLVVLAVWPRGSTSVHLTLGPGAYRVRAARTTRAHGGPTAIFRVVRAKAGESPAAEPAPTPPAPQAPVEPPATSLDGKGLFQTFCGGCHTLAAAGTSGRIGPSLDRERPDFGKVVETLSRGKDNMPSFRSTLTTDQIGAVAAFVAQSTRGDDH